MSCKTLVTLAFAVAVLGLVCAETPTGNVTLIADGFTWAENLYFDGIGGLWVTECVRGELYRFTRTGGVVSSQVWVSGFERLLGLALSLDGSEMYGVAMFTNGSLFSHPSGIIAVDISTPGKYRLVANTSTLGNGLALDRISGFLYTACEVDFIPGEGRVFIVDPTSGAVQTLASGLWSSDGTWIDQRTSIVYVSEVVTATINAYNITTNALINSFKAPNATMIDDYTLAYGKLPQFAHHRAVIFGADFWSGNVVAFAADGTGEGVILSTGLRSPTSVRFGSGPGWDDPHSVYITEGGGFVSSTTNRRVWELHLPRQ